MCLIIYCGLLHYSLLDPFFTIAFKSYITKIVLTEGHYVEGSKTALAFIEC